MDVEVRNCDLGKGLGLFAKRNFKKDDVIFEEDPLVCVQFSWNATCKYRACDHCLRPLETALENARRLTGQPGLELPYPECCTTDKTAFTTCDQCGAEYCSESCKNKALAEYHRVLCIQTKERDLVHPLELLNEAWKQVHYPPETSSVILIVRLLARIIQSENPEIATQQTMQFCHRTSDEDKSLAHKLLSDKYADQQNQLFDLLKNVVPHSEVQQFLTPTAFQSLLALIGTNGQGVGTSAISQWCKNVGDLSLPDDERDTIDSFIDKLYDDMEAQSGSFLENEGVALYSLESKANHSCQPSAEVSFRHNSSRLSLVALKDIQDGEEIFISYLDECSLQRSRHSRRKELMENYLFLCNCEKCLSQADEPDVTSSEDEEMDE